MSVKRELIKGHVIDMLNDSFKRAIEKVDTVLNSGCVDIEGWSPDDKPMLLPKAMLIAILDSEQHQYNAKGTSYEKYIKKEAKNIRYFTN